MSKEVDTKDYCCCGLFHKHSLSFVAGTFLVISYGVAFARRVYAAVNTPTIMDGVLMAAAAVGFIVHVMQVAGNRYKSKGWYWPSLVFNVIWCLDQTRAAFFHTSFIISVLQHAEEFYKAAAVPHPYDRFIALIIVDLILTIGGTLVAYAFFAVIFSGYRYLSRKEKEAKVVEIQAPAALPEKMPITEFV